MSNHYPKKHDVVLGGSGVPHSGVVLGGLDGVVQRLTSPVAEQRCQALAEALKHGHQGMRFVIRALNDPIDQVRQAAYRLLLERPEPQARRAVERFYLHVNYGQLEQALASGQWQTADYETRRALFRACGLRSEVLPQPHPNWLLRCPCYDLRLIDQLWMHYSQGKFGFSVQQQIWDTCHDTYWDKLVIWSAFGDAVGWRSLSLLLEKRWKRYPELTFAERAPAGHLPFMGDEFGIFSVEAIATRLRLCALEETQLPFELAD